MTGTPIVARAPEGGSDAERPYSDIAVPVDFSSLGWRVLPLAEQLGQAFSAPVHLLHVDTSSPWSDADPEQLRLRATPFQRPVDVEVVPDHDVALGVARALMGRRSLVVMGSHGRTGAAEMFIDSYTEAILRAVDGAVVVAGPHFREGRVPLRRIVWCLDLDQPPPSLVDDVTGWGRHLGVAIELLTVSATGAGADDEVAQQQRRLALMADRLNADGLKASAVVLSGSRPGHTIVDYVNETPGTVTALATHARAAATRAVVGSVGMKVVRHAHGPVLLRHRDD
jgi:nucleotide-binding universal stress UspA family protein